MKYTPTGLVTKWTQRFQPNDEFKITAADLQEFTRDLADTFGVSVVNVPAYVPGATYAVDYLVRYGSGRESFYYAQQAGQLPAPLIGQSSVYWRLVPGPVPATQLSQRISLLEAQGIEGAGVVEARLYAIEGAPVPNVSNPLDGCWNQDGQTRTLYVRGFENYFDREGVLLDSDGVPVARVAVNVLLGTFERGLVLSDESFQAKLRSNGLQLEGPADSSGQFLGLDLNGLFAFVTGGGLLAGPVPMGFTFGAQQSADTGEREGFLRLFGPHVKGPEPTDDDDVATKQYVDQLVSTAQRAVREYVTFYTTSSSDVLDASYYNKCVGVDVPGDCVLTLPTPRLEDVGKVLALRSLAYAASSLLTLQGPNPLGATEDLARVPTGGTALVQVVQFERGYPFSGQAAAYVVLASSSVNTSPSSNPDPGGGVTPAQLAVVATTLPVTPTRTSDYTLVLGDAGQLVPLNGTNPVQVRVPPHAEAAFPVGTVIYVAQDGPQPVSIAPASGVTLRTNDGYKVPGQWLEVALHKRDLNTWVLKGGVS